MGGVGTFAAEKPVQAFLGARECRRELEAEEAEPRGAYRDQEGGDALDAARKVGQPPIDQVSPREAFGFHGEDVIPGAVTQDAGRRTQDA